jgi:hypothetical protein
MRSLIIAIACFIGLSVAVADSASRCLSYEPAEVTLEGTVIARSLPGPPNYQNIAHGDYPETVFFLKLNEPICVSGDPSSRLNHETHSRITEVQLFTRDLDLRRFVNMQVRASGSFFGAHMAYHRTPVVLAVVKLRAV